MTPFLVHFAVEAGIPLPVAVLLAVLGAGVIGLVNGGITLGVGIPSFIVTLGMLLIVGGVTFNLSDGFPARAPSGGLSVNVFGGAPFSGLAWVILIVAVMHVVLTKTRWGSTPSRAAMGAKESAIIIDLLLELKRRIDVSIILIAHNYAQVVEVCDRINLLRHGSIDYEAEVADTSVQELTDLVSADYRRRQTPPG